MPMRPPSSALRAIFRPWPSSPRRFSTGHFAIVEDDFYRRRAALAHFFFVTSGAEAGEIRFDEEGGNSLPAGRGIGFCKDDEYAGDAAVGDPGFCALEFVDGVVADGAGLDCGSVGAGLRFGEAEGAENFSGGEALQVFLLLRFRAEIEQGDLDGGIGDAQGGGHGGVDAGHFFQHEDVGDGVQAGSAPGFGHHHAAAAQGREFTDFVGGKFFLAVALSYGRAHFGFHELADSIANQFLVVAERKIHRFGCIRDANTGGRASQFGGLGQRRK